jgi:hypothetical protein
LIPESSDPNTHDDSPVNASSLSLRDADLELEENGAIIDSNFSTIDQG